MKETPVRGKSWSKDIRDRIDDLQDEKPLPFDEVEERDCKWVQNSPVYTPAKPLEKTKIVKQKKRDFPRR